MVLYCFTAAAFYSNTPSAIADPWGLVRLAIPSTAALAGLSLSNRFARNRPRSPNRTVIDVILAFGLAFLSQLILSRVKPEWTLPRWAPTQGGFVGIALLAIFRSLISPTVEERTYVSESGFLLEWEAEELSRRWRRARRACLAAAGVGVALGVSLLRAPLARPRWAGWLLLAGSVYLATIVARAVAPNEPPRSYLFMLRQYCGLLRGVAVSYYACLAPALVLLVWGGPVYLYWAPLIALLFAELNQRSLTGIKGRIGVPVEVALAQ